MGPLFDLGWRGFDFIRSVAAAAHICPLQLSQTRQAISQGGREACPWHIRPNDGYVCCRPLSSSERRREAVDGRRPTSSARIAADHIGEVATVVWHGGNPRISRSAAKGQANPISTWDRPVSQLKSLRFLDLGKMIDQKFRHAPENDFSSRKNAWCATGAIKELPGQNPRIVATESATAHDAIECRPWQRRNSWLGPPKPARFTQNGVSGAAPRPRTRVGLPSVCSASRIKIFATLVVTFCLRPGRCIWQEE